MPSYFVSVFTFSLGFILVMLLSQRVTDRAAQRQREIAHKGRPAQGVITRIWQPPLAGSFARIYFEFEPEGANARIASCHIDLRSRERSASLPAPGAAVNIRYLPENPAQAVIAKFVSRFS